MYTVGLVGDEIGRDPAAEDNLCAYDEMYCAYNDESITGLGVVSRS